MKQVNNRTSPRGQNFNQQMYEGGDRLYQNDDLNGNSQDYGDEQPN